MKRSDAPSSRRGLAVIVVVLAWATGASARSAQELATTSLDRTSIDRAVDALERLDTPCAYRVAMRSLLVERADPALATAAGRAVLELARRGADGACSGSFADLERALDELFAREDAAARGFAFHKERDLVHTSDARLERTRGAPSIESMAILKTTSFELLYENFEGADHVLRVLQPGRGPLILDLESLFAPVALDARSLDWWREYAWEQLAAADASPTRAVVLHKRERPDRRFRLELETGSSLPRAASYHDDAIGEQALQLGLYRYGSIAADSPQAWLRTVLHVTCTPRHVTIARYDLSDVRFDVAPRDVVIACAKATMLLDERESERRVAFASAPWPAELSPWIEHRSDWTVAALDAAEQRDVDSEQRDVDSEQRDVDSERRDVESEQRDVASAQHAIESTQREHEHAKHEHDSAERRAGWSSILRWSGLVVCAAALAMLVGAALRARPSP